MEVEENSGKVKMFDRRPISYEDKVIHEDSTWRAKLTNYIESKYKPGRNFKRMISNLVNFSNIKDGILLDIGCGSGWFRRYTKDVNYIGLDIMIRQDVEIDFPMVVGIGENLPFKDESVDHVLVLATLDHVINPAKVLKESYRILKRNGKIYILSSVTIANSARKLFVYAFLLFQKVIFFDYESIIRNFKKIVFKREDAYHTFEFTAGLIKEMMLKEGFSRVFLRNFLNMCFLKGEKYK